VQTFFSRPKEFVLKQLELEHGDEREEPRTPRVWTCFVRWERKRSGRLKITRHSAEGTKMTLIFHEYDPRAGWIAVEDLGDDAPNEKRYCTPSTNCVTAQIPARNFGL